MPTDALQEFRNGLMGQASAAYLEDPIPVHRSLRELGPLLFDPVMKIWLVTTHDACSRVFADPDGFVPDQRVWKQYVPPEDSPIPARFDGKGLLSLGRADHSRVRGLASHALTRRAVERTRGVTRSVVADVLAPLAGDGRMDVARDFAAKVPSRVLGRLLGVPGDLMDAFLRFADALVRTSFGPFADAETRRAAAPSIREGCDAVLEFIDRRRADPADDLMTGLIRAEEAGDRLSYEELVNLVSGLIIGGTETTITSIGFGVRRLLEHPDQLRDVLRHPNLWTAAVDEALRYDWIGPGLPRYAAQERELCGQSIATGDMLMLVIPAANMDPAVFEDPERFDLHRQRRHSLSFGSGVHYCMGANLARLEILESLRAVFALTRLELAGHPVTDPNSGPRRLAALPVQWKVDC